MSENTENKGGLPEAAKPHQFQPGQSGNPAGKKPGTLNRKTLATRYLEMAVQEKFQKLYEHTHGVALPAETIGEQLMAQLVARALAGDMSAIDRVLDAAMDKVPEKADINGNFFALLERARTKSGDELKLGDKGCLTPNGDQKPSS